MILCLCDCWFWDLFDVAVVTWQGLKTFCHQIFNKFSQVSHLFSSFSSFSNFFLKFLTFNKNFMPRSLKVVNWDFVTLALNSLWVEPCWALTLKYVDGSKYVWWSSWEKYLENICTEKGSPENFVVFSLLNTPNFRILRPALYVFLKKRSTNIWLIW